MKVRKLNSQGIEQFSDFLHLLKAEPSRLPPFHLLQDASFSVSFGNCEIEEKKFENKLQAAEYLADLMGALGNPQAEQDVGLWSWLSLFFFDQLCPKDRAGARKPRERSAYIAEPGNHQRYYRHLLLGPWMIYRSNRDYPARAMAFLGKPLPVIDDIVAQIASRHELISNTAIVELATTLYYDVGTRSAKKGAGGKGPGSPRRLADILAQFDVTWDLFSMDSQELLTLMPAEFERFKK